MRERNDIISPYASWVSTGREGDISSMVVAAFSRSLGCSGLCDLSRLGGGCPDGIGFEWGGDLCLRDPY